MTEHPPEQVDILPDGPAGERRRSVAWNVLKAIHDIATYLVLEDMPKDQAPPAPFDFQSMLDLSFQQGGEHIRRFGVVILAERRALKLIDGLPMALRADVLAVQMEDGIKRKEERTAKEAAEQEEKRRERAAAEAERSKRLEEVTAKNEDFSAQFEAFKAVYKPTKKTGQHEG